MYSKPNIAGCDVLLVSGAYQGARTMCLRSSAAMKASQVVAVSLHASNSAVDRAASMSACHAGAKSDSTTLLRKCSTMQCTGCQSNFPVYFAIRTHR